MMAKNHSFMGMILVLALLATVPAHAADTSPMIVASASPQPRFISLAGVRNGTAGTRVVAPLRSDRIAMNNGFMRIDRNMKTVRIQRAAPKKTEQAVVITRPQDKAVLDLFGDSAPVATPLPAGRVAGHAWPLPANAQQKFTSGYGTRNDPFHGKSGFHDGVDLSAPTGTPVLASADGLVTEVGSAPRFGNYVRVKHSDGTQSSYGHMSRQQVRVGQRVRQGQTVGAVGSTGRSTGPHLHYALSRAGKSMDPMLALRAPAQTGIRVANSGVRVIR